MNPSYTPSLDGQWGTGLPEHFRNRSTLPSGLSPDLAQETTDDSFGCQSCGKEYSRLCDLNKHVKTHSRPFKCPVEDCLYYISGWPTEKELARHFNDKHSSEPRVFSCLWHGCTYSSKRESNCKQHMEKVHGYNYVRSRAGGKEDGGLDKPATSATQVDVIPRSVQQPRNPLAIRTVPNFLLTPSPLEGCSTLPSDTSSPISLAGTGPYGPEPYIPWNSPVTRLSNSNNNNNNNEGFLQQFSQNYTSGSPITIHDGEWLQVPVDPKLHNPDTSSANTPETSPVTEVSLSRDDMLRALPTIVTPKTSPSVNSQVLTPVSEPSPVLNQHSGFVSEATTPQDSEGFRGQGHIATLGLGVTGHLNPFGKRQVRFGKDPWEDSDEDDEPPNKRNRTPGGNEEDSGDPKMICPFRSAHPEIYDLNVHSKYFSCHTEHHNISTVVRHLGRPAHNLDVDNSRQAISSFNATNEHGHPAAGLCKKCWRSFADPEAFESHLNTKCETVSRSKREKFQILLDTFCRTNQDSYNDESGGSDNVEDAEGDSEADASRSATSYIRREDVVSRREYQALVDRVATLERMIATRMPQSTPRTLPQQATVARAFTPSPAMQSQSFDYYSYETAPSQSRAPAVVGREPRTSMVGGMDTQTLGTGDQSVTSFYLETDRSMNSFRPTPSRRTDSVSTVRRASPLTAAPHPGGQQQQQQQHAPARAVSDSAYGTEAAAAAAAAAGAAGGRGGGGGGQQMVTTGNAAALVHLPSHQVAQAAVSFENPGTGATQQPAGAMMRDRWGQGVEAGGSEMMQRMDFFNSQGSAEDIAKYLNMDSHQ
ncbi:hypothetical protein M406DRAFT_325835 [Cryphonectria parasitica EP155]|uniref:C2H2-type domain-containing protein n=1 Tax=Cryphonectria parasitica (strain ATCC 38755 / EP155) TaxID=660469 RepID=A0A9P5CU51_CRYP1|nr:uncharacterized protein M406DRAFT_325835 [Cryphonectria parasitica EP155]KAF3770387.1 hypothetical protein M406DRAFT_325835 [Cryphonectria parasitica EP155]